MGMLNSTFWHCSQDFKVLLCRTGVVHHPSIVISSAAFLEDSDSH